jgi:hypothetical protein
MGYDLHMCRKPRRIPPGFEPQYEGQPEYFRFNVFGMQSMRQIMQRAELLDDDVDVDWPEFPPAGWDDERAWTLVEAIEAERAEDTDHPDGALEIEPPPTLPERVAVTNYLAARDVVRAVRSPDPALVPAVKFSSNDGWLVTPEECLLIAHGLRRALDESGPALWEGEDITDHEARRWIEQWIAYNLLAADNGGYRVD